MSLETVQSTSETVVTSDNIIQIGEDSKHMCVNCIHHQQVINSLTAKIASIEYDLTLTSRQLKESRAEIADMKKLMFAQGIATAEENPSPSFKKDIFQRHTMSSDFESDAINVFVPPKFEANLIAAKDIQLKV
jgi:hypothetical protein